MKTRHAASMVVILFFTLLATACIEKETDHTFCLEPDGSIAWIVWQSKVHAVADTPADRVREETEFLAGVEAERHEAAVAFRALGSSDIRTQTVSRDWPYAVRTEARFADIGQLWQRYFDGIGVRAKSTLTRSSGRTTWTLVVDTDQEDQLPDSEEKKALESLLDAFERSVFFIRHGQFVEATGFALDDDSRVAKLEDLSERDWKREPRLVLSLTWVGTETSGKERRE